MFNRILSVDWDYITGDCAAGALDGHCGFCKNFHTKPPFIRGSIDLLRKNWKERFNRINNLKVPRKIPIYVAECHAEIFKIVMRHYNDRMVVIDFDHHYDNYYPDDKLNCGNWISHLKKSIPSFKVERAVKNYTYLSKAIFFCRSAPWTPLELDIEFLHLVHNFCKKTGSSPTFIGHMGKSFKKFFSHIHSGTQSSFMNLENAVHPTVRNSFINLENAVD